MAPRQLISQAVSSVAQLHPPTWGPPQKAQADHHAQPKNRGDGRSNRQLHPAPLSLYKAGSPALSPRLTHLLVLLYVPGPPKTLTSLSTSLPRGQPHPADQGLTSLVPTPRRPLAASASRRALLGSMTDWNCSSLQSAHGCTRWRYVLPVQAGRRGKDDSSARVLNRRHAAAPVGC